MPRHREASESKSWYEDKQSFCRALARCLDVLAAGMLRLAARCHRASGERQAALLLEETAQCALAARSCLAAGSPVARSSHGSLAWPVARASTVMGRPRP